VSAVPRSANSVSPVTRPACRLVETVEPIRKPASSSSAATGRIRINAIFGRIERLFSINRLRGGGGGQHAALGP
jgi:hypothetical protein